MTHLFPASQSLPDPSYGWHKWPNFSRAEMSCRHCGEIYEWPDFMDRLQHARNIIGQPMHILSAHRCAMHNASVSGAPFSQHLKLAVDIALDDHSPGELIQVFRQAGFTGYGFYTTFLHVDLGRSRYWFGNRKAEQLWQIYLD